jgi:RNA polymerase sigma-70 factor, ECF subfamily
MPPGLTAAADVTPGDHRRSDAQRHQAFVTHVLPEVEVLLRVALTLTHHRADAEDLVQDTLIRAFTACGRFDGRHPRAWLMTILRNTHLNRMRSRRPGLLVDPEAHDAEHVTWPGAPRPPTPEDVVVDQVLDAAVSSAMAALPEVFGSVVRLVDVDGLSYAEAATALGVPPGTVMSRLHRGRARIRDHLARSGSQTR